MAGYVFPLVPKLRLGTHSSKLCFVPAEAELPGRPSRRADRAGWASLPLHRYNADRFAYPKRTELLQRLAATHGGAKTSVMPMALATSVFQEVSPQLFFPAILSSRTRKITRMPARNMLAAMTYNGAAAWADTGLTHTGMFGPT